MASAVDEEGRRAAGAARLGADHVLLDAAQVAAVLERAGHLLDVDPDAAGVAEQVLELELVLVVEQLVVGLPESALHAGLLHRLGGQLGMGVDVDQRQVADHVAEVVAEPSRAAPSPCRSRGRRGALEVGVLDQRPRRVDRAADVVARWIDRRISTVGSLAETSPRSTAASLSGEPADADRQRRRDQHADLRLLACSVGELEGEPWVISSETVKSIAERSAADDLALADALRQLPSRARIPPSAPNVEMPSVLPDDEAGDDRLRQRRAERVAQHAVAHVDAGVGERAQRHDHERGPWVQVLLQPLVGETARSTDRAVSRATLASGDRRKACALRRRLQRTRLCDRARRRSRAGRRPCRGDRRRRPEMVVAGRSAEAEQRRGRAAPRRPVRDAKRDLDEAERRDEPARSRRSSRVEDPDHR